MFNDPFDVPRRLDLPFTIADLEAAVARRFGEYLSGEATPASEGAYAILKEIAKRKPEDRGLMLGLLGMGLRLKRLMVVVLAICLGCNGEYEAVPLWQGVEVSRIGSLDEPSTAFFRVSHIARDRAGRIYVADAGNSTIRVYDRSGDHIRDIGRPGSGPGEFEHLDRVIVVNDTVYALHSRGFRAAFFDTSGALLRTIMASPEPIGGSALPQLPSWQFSDGTAVAGTATALADESLPLLRTDRYGTIIDTATFVLPGGVAAFISDQRRTFLTNPFARPGRVPAFSEDGTMAQLTVHPDGDLAPGEFHLVVSGVGGGVEWERVYQTVPVQYAASTVDSLIEATIRPVAGLVTEAEFRDAVDVPEHQYPVGDILFDEIGGIWVQIATPQRHGAVWLNLDDHGIQRRRVQLSAHANPQIILGDTVFALETDDLGVQYVVEYRLVEEGA